MFSSGGKSDDLAFLSRPLLACLELVLTQYSILAGTRSKEFEESRRSGDKALIELVETN